MKRCPGAQKGAPTEAQKGAPGHKKVPRPGHKKVPPPGPVDRGTFLCPGRGRFDSQCMHIQVSSKRSGEYVQGIKVKCVGRHVLYCALYLCLNEQKWA